MSTPAIIYAAKSTTDPRGSIPGQLEDCHRLIDNDDRLAFVAEYADEAESAYSADRGPELVKAMEHCQRLVAEHGRTALVIQHSDRLARGDGEKARHLVEVVLWARKAAVTILSDQDPQTFDGRGLVYAALMGDRNYEDSARKSKAVKAGLRRRAAERGKLVGGPRPYGYRWVSELIDGRKVSHLQVVPAEAEVVKRIFTDTVNGVSQRALCRQLNKDGIRSATGKAWGPATIGRLLMNPLYKGMVRNAGEVFPGIHEPLVSEELWDRAEAIRSSQARRGGGRWPKGSHLFTGSLLRCHCGSAMLPRTDPNRRGGLYQVYQCSGRLTHGLDFCDQRVIERALVDQAMLNELDRHYLDIDETRERLETKLAADMTVATAALREADSEAQRAEARIARVQRAFQDGYLEAADYAQQRAQLLEEDDAAKAAVQRATEHADALKATPPLADAEAAVLRHLTEIRKAVAEGVSEAPDLNALRTIMKQLFEVVVLLPADHAWLGQVSAMRESGAEIEGYVLLPSLREDTVLGRDRNDVAIVRRAALPLGETAYNGLHT
jgi:hypothetical protein